MFGGDNVGRRDPRAGVVVDESIVDNMVDEMKVYDAIVGKICVAQVEKGECVRKESNGHWAKRRALLSKLHPFCEGVESK
jgi:hypothetical protein